MSALSRRQALGVLASLPVAAGLTPLVEGVSPAAAQNARDRVQGALAEGPYSPKFFTAAEWRTVRVLADLVLPRDERGPSATEAGAPEFMDYILSEYHDQQLRMRGGLAWLEHESLRRYGTGFVESGAPSQRALFDDIAWPARARPEMKPGAAFFSRFRDLIAAGYWSSPMGIEDIRYRGNTGMPEWHGCPPEALAKLGVRYPEGGA